MSARPGGTSVAPGGTSVAPGGTSAAAGPTPGAPGRTPGTPAPTTGAPSRTPGAPGRATNAPRRSAGAAGRAAGVARRRSFLRLRRRVWRWWEARHPRTDTWTLTQSHVYIVPTRAGLVFALTLLTMLVASINYQLNLGYVLTFLLAGSGLASLHLTHATLRGLTLRLRPPSPGFAGEPAPLEVVLTNPGRARHGIAVSLHGRRAAPAWVDVPAAGQAVARLSFVPVRRGLHEVPALSAQTRFPFGLFRAWTVWRPAARVLAWPAPERPAAPLPVSQAQAGDAPHRHAAPGGELEGVRAYRRGDALRHVVWKKAARSGELVSRDTSAASRRELWLDYQAAALPGVEQRLARLAAWVLAAEAAGIAHGLRLPGVEVEPGHGDAHRLRALQELALWS